jgi:hypothetical protein
MANLERGRKTFTGVGMSLLFKSLALPLINEGLPKASLSAFVSSVLLVLGPMVNKKYLTVISGLQVLPSYHHLIPAASRRIIMLMSRAQQVWGYLARVSSEYFKDSVMFPAVLTGLGFSLISAGSIKLVDLFSDTAAPALQWASKEIEGKEHRKHHTKRWRASRKGRAICKLLISNLDRPQGHCR